MSDQSVIDYRPDQVPAQPAAARRPWYRKPVFWAAAATAIMAVVLTLLFTVVLPGGPSGAAGILDRDGYQSVVTLNGDQIATLAGTSGDSALLKTSIIGGAVGIKGGTMEAVFQLSDAGKTLMTAVLPTVKSDLPAGMSARLDGNYLIITGPASSIGNFGALGSGQWTARDIALFTGNIRPGVTSPAWLGTP